MLLLLEHTLAIDLWIGEELRTQEGQHDLKEAGKESVVSPRCQNSHLTHSDSLWLTVKSNDYEQSSWEAEICSIYTTSFSAELSTTWRPPEGETTRLISSKVLEQSQVSEPGWTPSPAHVGIQNTENTVTYKCSLGGKPEWGNHRLGKHSSCFHSTWSSTCHLPVPLGTTRKPQ